jgi:hypothetical protein
MIIGGITATKKGKVVRLCVDLAVGRSRYIVPDCISREDGKPTTERTLEVIKD